MPDKNTRPFGEAQRTTQLREGTQTPRETILNSIIDEYSNQRMLQGHEITTPPTTEDINFILAKYCDEHPDLSSEEKCALHTTIQTLLELRIHRHTTI